MGYFVFIVFKSEQTVRPAQAGRTTAIYSADTTASPIAEQLTFSQPAS